MCPVSDIARASGREPEEVERDLLDMVRRGYFPLGFVDAETACFYAPQCRLARTEPRSAPAEQDAPLGQRAAPARARSAQEPVPEDEPGGGYLRELERQLARIENADIRAKAGAAARAHRGYLCLGEAAPRVRRRRAALSAAIICPQPSSC